MRSVVMGLVLAILPTLANAATPQSYDLIATSEYPEPDGTMQPAGTCIGRVAWDGVASFAPSGVSLVLDVAQTKACYTPKPSTTPAVLPVPNAAPAFVKGVLQTPMSDGTIALADSGVAAVSQTTAAVKAALGATTGNGHTTTPMTLSFATVAVGGTSFVIPGVADPSSSIAPGVGAKCMIGTNTATPLPLSLLFDCTVTAPGVVSITALPRAGIALGAQSFTANVFWWW